MSKQSYFLRLLNKKEGVCLDNEDTCNTLTFSDLGKMLLLFIISFPSEA